MASIEQLVNGLRGVLQRITEGADHLGRAETAWTEAANTRTAAMQGSGQPEQHVLAELNGLVPRQLDEARTLLGQCTAAVETIIRRYAGEPASPPTEAPTRAPSPLEDRVSQARQRVGSSPIGSLPANGEWVRSDGWNVRMRSGRTDAYHDAVVRYVQQQLPREQQRARALATHIEVKVAVQMSLTGSTEETVVVDRSVCGTRPFDEAKAWTCDKRLADTFLPPGAKLHVIDPVRGKVTYEKEDGR